MVWLATALFVSVTALWTVAVPTFRAPDEPAHMDLVLYLAERHPYPRWDGRWTGQAVAVYEDRHGIDLAESWPRFDAAAAPDRADRADAVDLGGSAPYAFPLTDAHGNPSYYYQFNQMPQHPPLYYLGMAGILRVERWMLPGDEIPSLDREVGLLRLVNVLLVAPLPLLAWAAVRRLGGDQRAGIVAALLPLGLPQLTYIGASLNNDNLLVLLGGLLSVLLVGVGRGVGGIRTHLAVGLVLGLTLLTKALAVMFVPWVVAAYALGWWTTRHGRRSMVGLLVAGTVGAAVGGWWWIANWVRFGEPAPTTENLTRTTALRPPGFEPDPVAFGWTFAGHLVSRTWAWVGFGFPKFELPPIVVALLTLAVIAAVAVALAVAAAGPTAEAGPDDGPRRSDIALAWLPVLLLAIFVLRRAWGLYDTTGLFSFIQGRYLFASLVGPMAVVGIGAPRALGRWATGVALAVGLGLQAWVLTDVIQGAWTGPGTLGPLRGALAWSPWPPPVLAATAVLAAVLAATAAVESRPPRRPQPSLVQPGGGQPSPVQSGGGP